MANYLTYEFHIPMGLPGSGKTHYLKQQSESDLYHSSSFIYIDVDKHNDEETSDTYLWDKLSTHNVCKKGRWGYYLSDQKIYIDGLFLDENTVRRIIKTCTQYVEKTCKYDHVIKIILHVWNNDVDTCLKNDEFRIFSGEREKSSHISIKKLKYTPIDINGLNTILKESNLNHVERDVVKHDVYKLSSYDKIILPHVGKDSDGILKSRRWSTGGTYGTCWDDEQHIINPDTPLEFVEFYELLSNICPNITFLQYKKLYNKCVEKKDEWESDYYGGIEYFNYYTCDLRKLYEEMKEMDLLKE